MTVRKIEVGKSYRVNDINYATNSAVIEKASEFVRDLPFAVRTSLLVLDIKLIALLSSCTRPGHSVDDRSEWLNQIIDQIEWVGARSVMNAEGRE